MRVQNFFIQDDSISTFDDADRQVVDVSEFVSTSDIDAFRQGVEIRTHKQYIAGSVKIFSGERGHAITPQPIGQATNDNAVKFEKFVDKSAFYPLEFVSAGNWQEPFSIDDTSENTFFDGVIRFNSSVSDDVLKRTCDVFVTLIDGNTSNINRGSTQILSVDVFDEQNTGTAYDDGSDTEPSSSMAIEVSTVCPYIDCDTVSYDNFNKEFWPNDAPANTDISVVNLIIRSGARGNSYIQSWQISATSGFQFDSAFGTDSIAFGDMQY
jgi:hypothetical protein